jgi:hypothetical protein
MAHGRQTFVVSTLAFNPLYPLCGTTAVENVGKMRRNVGLNGNESNTRLIPYMGLTLVQPWFN